MLVGAVLVGAVLVGSVDVMADGDDVQRDVGSARAWLVYTALRLVVFLGTAGLFLIFRLNGFWLLLLALPVSAAISFVVLRPQRTALIAAQIERRQRRSAQRDALRSRLDELIPQDLGPVRTTRPRRVTP